MAVKVQAQRTRAASASRALLPVRHERRGLALAELRRWPNCSRRRGHLGLR